MDKKTTINTQFIIGFFIVLLLIVSAAIPFVTDIAQPEETLQTQYVNPFITETNLQLTSGQPNGWAEYGHIATDGTYLYVDNSTHVLQIDPTNNYTTTTIQNETIGTPAQNFESRDQIYYHNNALYRMQNNVDFYRLDLNTLNQTYETFDNQLIWNYTDPKQYHTTHRQDGVVYMPVRAQDIEYSGTETPLLVARINFETQVVDQAVYGELPTQYENYTLPVGCDQDDFTNELRCLYTNPTTGEGVMFYLQYTENDTIQINNAIESNTPITNQPLGVKNFNNSLYVIGGEDASTATFSTFTSTFNFDIGLFENVDLITSSSLDGGQSGYGAYSELCVDYDTNTLYCSGTYINDAFDEYNNLFSVSNTQEVLVEGDTNPVTYALFMILFAVLLYVPYDMAFRRRS